MMDRVFITDLLIRGIIGINEWEREKPQDILINVSLYSDLVDAGLDDDVEKSINYRTVTKKIIKHTEESQRFTVEALAEDIAAICLSDTRSNLVKVRVEKPGALRFAKSVGVEIERKQNG